MATFCVGRRIFPRKSDAVDAVKAVLNGATLNRPLAGDDRELVQALLLMHPRADLKAAAGVAGIVVRQITYRPGIIQRCFHVIHPDGSETDFSYRQCFGMAPRDGGIAEAARYVVWPDIIAYKSARFGSAETIPCDVTGSLVLFAEADVDHAPPWPFSRILREFLAIEGRPDLRDEGVRMVFADEGVGERFKRFHDERAVLRVVYRPVNMSMGARAAA